MGHNPCLIKPILQLFFRSVLLLGLEVVELFEHLVEDFQFEQSLLFKLLMAPLANPKNTPPELNQV